MDPAGRVIIQTVINGDTVREVLAYVEFDAGVLLHQMRSDVDQAVREQRLDDFQAARLLRFYEEGLNGYTYLEDVAEAQTAKVGPYEMPARV
jgi:arginine decarboxylase